jgi:hypothetical protein
MNHIVCIAFTGLVSDENGVAVSIKGAGKDTAADMVADMLPFKPVHLSFADEPKDCVSDYWGLPRSIYDTSETKESPIPEYPGMTYRLFLEKFATDVVRKRVCESTWVNKVRRRLVHASLDPLEELVHRTCDLSPVDNPELFEAAVKDMRSAFSACGLPETHASRPVKLFQITDLRFVDEYRMLRKLNALIVQVRRTKTAVKGGGHVSDIPKPEIVPDVVIDNNGSLEDLRTQIRHILLPRIL